MPYLYLVRHAQPDFTGHYDSVTERGLRQSAWLGEHFSARGLRFARVISGSLERQKGTLEAILQRLPDVAPRITDPRFNEYDAASVLGAFQLGDERALRATGDRRGYFKAVREALYAWSRQDQAIRGGESWRQFGERISAGVARRLRGAHFGRLSLQQKPKTCPRTISKGRSKKGPGSWKGSTIKT